MNRNSDFSILFLLIGVLMGFVLVNFFPGSLLKTAKTAIEECEKNLPRNQHCIINAIPESKNEQ